MFQGFGDYEKYPNLSENEVSTLKAIAKHLYTSTQSELDKAISRWDELENLERDLNQ